MKHEQRPIGKCGRGVKRTSVFELASPLGEISRKRIVGDDPNPAAVIDKPARLASPVVEISPGRDRCNPTHPFVGRCGQQGQTATSRRPNKPDLGAPALTQPVDCPANVGHPSVGRELPLGLTTTPKTQRQRPVAELVGNTIGKLVIGPAGCSWALRRRESMDQHHTTRASTRREVAREARTVPVVDRDVRGGLAHSSQRDERLGR